MKTLKYILMMAFACSLTTSCMDRGWEEPEKTPEEIGLGNKYLQETNVITIAKLKQTVPEPLSSRLMKVGYVASFPLEQRFLLICVASMSAAIKVSKPLLGRLSSRSIKEVQETRHRFLSSAV